MWRGAAADGSALTGGRHYRSRCPFSRWLVEHYRVCLCITGRLSPASRRLHSCTDVLCWFVICRASTVGLTSVLQPARSQASACSQRVRAAPALCQCLPLQFGACCHTGCRHAGCMAVTVGAWGNLIALLAVLTCVVCAGHRSRLPHSLPLKRGMLHYAYSRKMPVQVRQLSGMPHSEQSPAAAAWPMSAGALTWG